MILRSENCPSFINEVLTVEFIPITSFIAFVGVVVGFTTHMRIFQTNSRAIFERRKKLVSCFFARPLGNGSVQAAISPTKQVLVFGTLEKLSGSHVDLQSRQLRNWAEKEWSNGTEFSGYSYFPEYWDNMQCTPNIPKRDSGKCPFHSLFTRNLRNFWLNGKRPLLSNQK